MSIQAVPVVENDLNTPRIRRISMDEPWQWLAAGWRDTMHTPGASIAYGAIFAVMGYLLVQFVKYDFRFILALTSGFLLVGPFLATGLYDLSKRIEEGQKPTLMHALFAWRGNIRGILLFGLFVTLLLTFWVRIAAALYGLLASESGFMIGGSEETLYFTGQGLTFLLVFLAVGGVIAALVYVVSAISIPMMVDDKHTDLVLSVMTSVKAVRVNTGPMILWAGLIVAFTGAGLLTFYIGLAVALPVIGHGTWHAYRSLVLRDSIMP